MQVCYLPWMALWLALAGAPAVAAEAQTDVGCGYISAKAKPPLSDDIYPAEIRRIDGVDVPSRPQNRYRLSAGRHAIAIQERIGSTPRGYGLLRKLGNREVALVYKIIQVDIAAGSSLQLGAHLLRAQLDPAQPPHAYWEPVVWRSGTEVCR